MLVENQVKELVKSGIKSEYRLCMDIYGNCSNEAREMIVKAGIKIGHFRKSKNFTGIDDSYWS